MNVLSARRQRVEFGTETVLGITSHTRRWMLVAGIAIRFHLLNEIAGSLRATREMATHCQLISGDTKIQWKLRHLNDPKRRNVCSTVNSGDGPRKKYYFFFCRNMAVRWWLINISGDSEADRQVIKSKWLCRTYQNSVSYMYINNGFAQDGAQFAISLLLHLRQRPMHVVPTSTTKTTSLTLVILRTLNCGPGHPTRRN